MFWRKGAEAMEVLEAIHTRRSIRKYTNEPVAPELIEKLLRAAMAAPSATNSQPWCLLIINRREDLDIVSTYTQLYGALTHATAAILVCGDMSKVRSGSQMWAQGCAAATQNILLAAHGLGIGAVWLGVFPGEKNTTALRAQFALPENVTPFALVSLGHPEVQKPSEDRYDAARVHFGKW
jgi:nitroreductase